MSSSAPIGVFDSGVGGLTVARRLLARLPNERIVYVADQAHVPYGGRDLAEVRRFAFGISEALFSSGCKAVVMACNISSAVALDLVRSVYPDRVTLGVIAPGAEQAFLTSRNRRVGVLATAGTVHSRAYTRALHALDPQLSVIEVACPDFVPIVEAGAEASPEALLAAYEYLAPMREHKTDTVILGCTHYPFLLPTLRDAWSEPSYVDPAEQTTALLHRALREKGLLAEGEDAGASLLTTSGDRDAFTLAVRRFLPACSPFQFAGAVWSGERLRIG